MPALHNHIAEFDIPVPDMTLPDPARYAMDAASVVGATFEDLDDGRGYLFRISKNGKSVVSGGGGVCAYPVNSAIGFTVARDKAHTKSMLAAEDIAHIPGGLFFSHQRRVSMRGPGREIDDAIRYATELGFPVFCKPNQGGRGNFAEIIMSAEGLADYARRVQIEFESFLVEPIISGEEHRVLVQDGRALVHITKGAPQLVGDGERTLRQLFDDLNASFTGTGVSPLPVTAISLIGRDSDEILLRGESLVLPGRRNLHAAGAAERVTELVPERLAAIGIAAVDAVALRVGAVDLFDTSEKGDLSELVVIEVNGNPGLLSLEKAGRMDLIRRLWTDMLNECLGN